MYDKNRDCNQCGHPAVYRDPDGGLVCEACPNSDHGFQEGRQFMAAEHLMLAAEIARARGYSEADLHALITEAMKGEPEEVPHADVPRLSTDEFNLPSARRWLKPLTKIGGLA